MKYLIAEKFKSVQGEGVYAGTPMAFIRFVGCSVGKKICSACDTDFEEPVMWRGGGEFTVEDLDQWVDNYEHVCFTGGEPFDQELLPLVEGLLKFRPNAMIHIESSGTKLPEETGFEYIDVKNLWLCVSPKPGFLERVVMAASEVKVIMPGLGVMKHGVMQPAKRLLPLASYTASQLARSEGQMLLGHEEQLLPWPTLEDALRWVDQGKTVFIQPRNERNEINMTNLRLCQDIVAQYPRLRLSVQLHKILKVQ